MLSTAAFNALLKTLEEPPSHVVFVMCTTHPNKVPETIQSRCQRFDFRRLSVEDIVDRLRFIAAAEGMTIDRNAFTLMARHAKGGMRDAITALEQITSYTGGEVTADDVEGMLGEVDTAQLFEVAALIARRDIAACFRWVASEVETGTELAEMVRELTAHFRDLFVIAAVGDASGVVDRSAEDLSRLQAQAAEFGGPDRLARLLDVLGDLAAEMRWSSDPRMSIEVTLTRMARPQGEMTLEALAERVEALERSGVAVSAGSAAAPSVAAPVVAQDRGVATGDAGVDAAHDVLPADAATEPAAVSGASAPVAVPAPAAAPVAAAGPRKLDRAAVKRDWPAVVMEVKKLKPARVQTFANVEVDVDADGDTLVVEFPSDQAFSIQLAEDPDTRELLKRALASVFGAAPPFRYQLGRGAVRPVAPPKPSAPARIESSAAHDEPKPRAAEQIEPVADVDESSSAGEEAQVAEAQSPVSSGDEPLSELEKLLTGDMGAQIVDTRVLPADEQES